MSEKPRKPGNAEDQILRQAGLPVTDAEVLARVADGVDVYDYHLAKRCRQLQKKKLVIIVKAKHPPRNGAAQQPYFGCRSSAAGRKLLADGSRSNTVVGKCRVCGCTDAECSQCVKAQGYPCSWANDKHDLCSRCAKKGGSKK